MSRAVALDVRRPGVGRRFRVPAQCVGVGGMSA
jgi:hypothetical protein